MEDIVAAALEGLFPLSTFTNTCVVSAISIEVSRGSPVDNGGSFQALAVKTLRHCLLQGTHAILTDT
jgi:hypothetical protein